MFRNKTLSLYILIFTFITACTFTQKIRDGDTAFERKQYAVAAKMLSKEYNKSKSRIEKGKKAFLIGESYRRMNKNEASIEWYKIAYDNQFGIDALKEYAFALKKNEQYVEAAAAFKNLGLEIGSPYEYRREITACNQSIDWLKGSKDNVYKTELSSFNTGSAEYAPTAYGNDFLVITSDRNQSTGDDTYNWTGSNFSDLFLVNLKTNSSEPFDAAINTPNNEGTVSFNVDFTEMYFSRCFSEENRTDIYCKLMMSKKEGDSWTEPSILSFVEDKVNYGHPSLTPDGGTLYFSSNHPEGWGGYDIYTVDRTPEGWDIPQLMGRTINTDGNEKFPFIDQDTLYFASDYHTGLGGLDVFKSYKIDSDNWTPVYNLKPPINSGADDFGFIIDYRAPAKDGVLQAGYFTSSREDGKGSDDIYRFEKGLPPPPPPVDTTKEPEPIVYKMTLNGFILEKIYRDPTNPNSEVIGRKPLDQATATIGFNGNSENIVVGPDGKFSIELEENMDYNFLGSKDGYLNNTGRFSSKGIGKDPANPVTSYEVEIVLDKIFKNQEITLENIYYDYDKAFIRSDAAPTLNNLATILTRNPNIKIQLSSHTDCRGKTKYNKDLSQRRAQSAVDYLITKLGISSSRLTAVGYGKESPAVDCLCSKCTEEEHQINRRTTFKIVE